MPGRDFPIFPPNFSHNEITTHILQLDLDHRICDCHCKHIHDRFSAYSLIFPGGYQFLSGTCYLFSIANLPGIGTDSDTSRNDQKDKTSEKTEDGYPRAVAQGQPEYPAA